MPGCRQYASSCAHAKVSPAAVDVAYHMAVMAVLLWRIDWATMGLLAPQVLQRLLVPCQVKSLHGRIAAALQSLAFKERLVSYKCDGSTDG